MEKKYFITLGLKALHYDSYEEAARAKERFSPIYPMFDIRIYEGREVERETEE